ncbi:hypothetical protein [Rubellimicrobium mesophilum]|uniref:hypothetical protein n=1 Tax=Rubellimicrobium mesophilum TaxID=1123067 RepID=UPI00056097A5|nr:hypothetical protein [Rubellimicrobium mesophilum]
MSDIYNDDQKPVATSEDHPTDGLGGDDSSRPEETMPLGDDAAAVATQDPRSVRLTSEHSSLPDTALGTEDERPLSKAKLMELGRRFAKKQKEDRRKARARAAQEKAMGLLTITLKCHKADRRLIMGAGKEIIILLGHMREANLNPGSFEDGLTKFLEDYYQTHVGPHVKKKR